MQQLPHDPNQPQSQYPQQPPPQYYQQPGGPYVPPPYYQQPMMQQPSYLPQPAMYSNVNVNVQQKSGPGFLIRLLYFMFVGWYVGFIWLHIGFLLCALIVTLPLGLAMLNRLPQVMTLKLSRASTQVNVSTAMSNGVLMQNVNVSIGGTQQQSFLVRAVYYCLVGWWAGYLWAVLAYVCCCFLVTIPLGMVMFEKLPAVLTLRRD